MANHPEVHDHHIEIIMEGDQDATTIQDLIRQNDSVIGRFVASSKPLNLLVDITNVGHVSASAISAGIQTAKHHTYPFNKMAIHGVNKPVLREIVAAIVNIFSDGGKVHIATTHAEAIAFLEDVSVEFKPHQA